MAIQTLNTIKNWFLRGCYPTGTQFGETWDSFWHKQEDIPIENIQELNQILIAKAEAQAVNSALNDFAIQLAKTKVGQVNIEGAYVDIVFPIPYADGSIYNVSKMGINASGEDITCLITNKTEAGFRVRPVEPCQFGYTCTKI